MRLVRAKLKLGTWCALFALALQLVLPFGHFHRSWIGPTASPALFVSAAGQIIREAFFAGGGGPSDPSLPGADYCDICAVVSLAGSAVPPVAPVIVPPDLPLSTLAWSIPEIALTPIPRLLAQARAPPQA
jgi:hypothetical protein